MFFNKYKKEHGYLNMLAILILVILSLVTISYIELSQTQLRSISDYSKKFQKYYSAESGIEKYISLLKQDPTYDKNLPICPTNSNGRLLTEVLNGEEYAACLEEITRNEVSIDTNGDGIVDTIKVNYRKVTISSSTHLEKFFLTIKVTLEINVDLSNGKNSINILKWEYVK